MTMHGFMKGMGMGMLAGIALTVAIVPMDKKRIMRSPVGKTIRTTKSIIEDIHDAF